MKNPINNVDALLVIDMLNDFVLENGSLYVPNAKNIVPFIINEINYARVNNIPIIYICDSHKRNDKEFELFPVHCLEDTFGSQIIDELSPTNKDIIVKKTTFSGFYKTALDEMLKEMNCKTLEITGILTNICVLYTAYDATIMGYKVVIKKHLVTSNNRYLHNFALRQLKIVHKVEII